MEASPALKEYFAHLEKNCQKAFSIAQDARKKGYDPAPQVEISLAKNMAERVIGLISIAAPQIVGKGAEQRILELENTYGAQDWRVALSIAEEIAREKFCTFKDQKEAMEFGIRAGFTYATVGVVSSPLEGFTSLELKERLDGTGKYFCLNYAGPIRNAGGTAAAFSVIIADFIRKRFGFLEYDPTELEVKRTFAEIMDYHEFITNLQYVPSQEEMDFLMRHLPVEISGDPSEKYGISNVKLKDLPRVKTNLLRSGFCLIHSSCIPLKAPKLWKQLSDWGKDFSLGHWNFLEEFLKIQKKAKAKGKVEKKEQKLEPDFTFIHDLVAGRPVIGHPLANGSLRIRYGRSRVSGFSAQSIHPATMAVLDEFVATATQLKVEMPGKAAAFSPCDTIDGPVVKLADGSVVYLDSEAEAKKVRPEIKEILYLGDVLTNYGDFFNRAHVLVPPGYCPEFWIKELEKAVIERYGSMDIELISKELGLDEARVMLFFEDPLKHIPSSQLCFRISDQFGVPLHPNYTYFWNSVTLKELEALFDYLQEARILYDEKKIILPYDDAHQEKKRSLELLGLPHLLVSKEFVVIQKEDAESLFWLFDIKKELADGVVKERFKKALATIQINQDKTPLEILILITGKPQRDKAGTFIGARMGRPEKAKMRKLVGSPHVLFPVGSEGGRLRSFQECLEEKKITAEFPLYFCEQCKRNTVYAVCEVCDQKTSRRYYCPDCGVVADCPHPQKLVFKKQEINPQELFDASLKKLKTQIYPDLIKGVKGTSNKEHIPEQFIKGILRAKHNLAVNKDGTVRYDCSEVTLTHFKPKEVSVPLEKLKELGYTHDIHGLELENEEQVLELRPQDIVLPCCTQSPDEPSDVVLFRVTKFIDELLVKLYRQKPFYKLDAKEDLVGHLVIGLAPHTSAGILGRIIGFSKTQAFFAHPLFHAAMRRDCFTADTFIPLKKDGAWQVERIGDVVEGLAPARIVDAHGTREVRAQGYATFGVVNGNIAEVQVSSFTKHTPMPIIAITTALGKRLRTTANHKHIVVRNGKEIIVRAESLQTGDVLKLPYCCTTTSHDVREMNLLEELKDREWLMVRGLKGAVPDLAAVLRGSGVPEQSANNFAYRDSVPARIAINIMREHRIPVQDVRLAAKYDTVTLPAVIDVTDELLQCIGLYVAEGYARQQTGKKGSYQVYIAAERSEIRAFVQQSFRVLGLTPSERKKDRVTYSSRILYEFFVHLLGAGSSAYGKRLPARFLTLPPARLGKLLTGYLEGDGSVSATDLRLVFDTASEGLIHDMEFVLARLGVFLKLRRSTRKPGKRLAEFYVRKRRDIPLFTSTRGIVQSKFVHQLSKHISFISQEKRARHAGMLQHKKFRNLFCQYDDRYFYDDIFSIEEQPAEQSYCLNVENHQVIANGILTRQCDGDESCIFLLMDAFLNFSRKYLPSSRGSTMDAPLVLTTFLNPSEVDDMAFHMDIAWTYPLEFYLAALNFEMPWAVKIKQLGHVLNTPDQFEHMGFTHDTDDFNKGVVCSQYKLLPSMEEKLRGQMNLAVKLRAVDQRDVARLVIEKHFIRDTRGNLRKFSQQEFRCVKCNEKFRRPPLIGKCSCGGRILFTISEGSVTKYLEPSIQLAEKYGVPDYLKQNLELTKRRIEALFGKDKEKQEGLGKWVI
ncbi:MAG: DNA polymerase II large subunit [Nanoarchaeota archaeon]